MGLAGGIFGNVWVTSLYRMIDGGYRGNNVLVFIVGLIGFSIIMILLHKKSNESLPRNS